MPFDDQAAIRAAADAAIAAAMGCFGADPLVLAYELAFDIEA